MNKYLYVESKLLGEFDILSIGAVTYSNIRKYILDHRLPWTVTIDDFGNLYVEQDVDILMKSYEFVKVATLLKGGRFINETSTYKK